MKRKSRTAERMLGTVVLGIIAMMLLAGTVMAASNPINVPFIPQYPPGTSWTDSKNCGQTSSLMVFSYYDGTTPTQQGIKDIDTWLYSRYGDKDPISIWNGWFTDTTKLETLAKEYGGKYGTFPYTYKSSGWKIDRVKQEIDAGHPVIVEVDGAYLPGRKYRVHYLVVTGYTSTDIITNDPGRDYGYGNGAKYSSTDFAAAMNARGGAVVVVRPNTITATSPNGGDYWRISYPNTVQWKYSSDLGYPGSTVKIELLKGTTVIPVTTLNVPIGSNGQGLYTIPAYGLLWKASPGSDYKIRVTTNYGYSDTSKNYFTITS